MRTRQKCVVRVFDMRQFTAKIRLNYKLWSLNDSEVGDHKHKPRSNTE
jgi:hypothetical protein